MAFPCPSCRNPLGLTIEHIIKNDQMACPHCYAILSFKVKEETTKRMQKGLAEIEKIKKKYSNIAKFG